MSESGIGRKTRVAVLWLSFFDLVIATERPNNPTEWGPDKDILREVTTLDDLLDILCWLAPLFLIWYKLWEHVYYREDDEE